jgi:hypothetical protein
VHHLDSTFQQEFQSLDFLNQLVEFRARGTPTSHNVVRHQVISNEQGAHVFDEDSANPDQMTLTWMQSILHS